MDACGRLISGRKSGSVLRAVPRLLHHTLRSRVVRLLDLFGILAIKVDSLIYLVLSVGAIPSRRATLSGTESVQGMSHIGARIVDLREGSAS